MLEIFFVLILVALITTSALMLALMYKFLGEGVKIAIELSEKHSPIEVTPIEQPKDENENPITMDSVLEVVNDVLGYNEETD